MERILTQHTDQSDQPRLAAARERGAYDGLRKALGLTRHQIIAEVTASGLRGRGGAGFPTGRKWDFIRPQPGQPVYLLCNADESEPGTFKDRYLMERDPHLVIGGLCIAAYAIGAPVWGLPLALGGLYWCGRALAQSQHSARRRRAAHLGAQRG